MTLAKRSRKRLGERQPGIVRWLWAPALILAAVAPQPLTAANAKVRRAIETEVVRLTRFGFEPSRIVRPAGTFRLFVQSTIPVPSPTLLLENESKVASKTHKLKGRSTERWVEDHSLSSGKYFLRVKEAPELTLEIVVE